jgi:excisionase family DNA binding protein
VNVAAHAVAVPGDPEQLADHRLLRRRPPVVELQRIRPTREVRVPAVRQEEIAARPPDAGVVPGRPREVELGPEAAERLGVSVRHLRAMLTKIPHLHLGGRVVIPVDDLRRWLSEQAREQQAERQAAVEAFLRGSSSS